MKVTQEPGLAIEASHDFKKRAFTMKMSPEAIRLLSSGIYQDATAAVIRELSTNAYDSHVQAEKGVKNEDGSWKVKPMPNRSQLPFDVTLPTSMSPIFKLRDYGTGLDEDDIFNVYTVYFGSTKNQSNDFVGEKGLGSKSPFAIVSSFLVISFFNGTKTVYSALIGEDGFPDLVKMHSNPTDEANGIEINISVSSSDSYTFLDRAKKIYPFFDVKPNMLGSNKFEIQTIKYDQRDPKKNWAIRSTHSGLNVGVVEGQVCYPVTTSALEGKIDANLLNFYKQWQDRLEMRFPIGSTNSAASREGLEYTTRTVESIRAALQDAITTLSEEIRKEIADAPSFIEATAKVRGLDANRKILANDLYNRGQLLWKARTVETVDALVLKHEQRVPARHVMVDDPTLSFVNNKPVKVKKTVYKQYANPYRMFSTVQDNIKPLASTVSPSHVWAVDDSLSYYMAHRFIVSSRYAIVLNDAKISGPKAREYIAKNRDKFTNVSTVIVINAGETKFLADLLQLFGMTDYLRTSTWGDIEVKKLIKSIRSYHYNQVIYNRDRRYMREYFNSKDQFNSAQMDELEDEKLDFYITSSGSPFTFTNIFERHVTGVYSKAYDTLELNHIIGGLIKIKHPSFKNVGSNDWAVWVVPKSSEDAFNKAFPSIRPLYKAFDELQTNQALLPINYKFYHNHRSY